VPATVNTSGYDLVVGPDPDGRYVLVAAGEKFPAFTGTADQPVVRLVMVIGLPFASL
jgi:hypothetical protein